MFVACKIPSSTIPNKRTKNCNEPLKQYFMRRFFNGKTTTPFLGFAYFVCVFLDIKDFVNNNNNSNNRKKRARERERAYIQKLKWWKEKDSHGMFNGDGNAIE